MFAHKAILSLVSEFFSDLMLAAETFETVSEVIVPDFSAFDISDFLLSVYGGNLPADTSTFVELAQLFGISALLGDVPSVKPTTDIGAVFGQICSEIEQEFFQPAVVESPVPASARSTSRYIRKRLPDNAQLLQLPRSVVSDNSAAFVTASSSIQSYAAAPVKTATRTTAASKRVVVASAGGAVALDGDYVAVTTDLQDQGEPPQVFVTDEVWEGQVSHIGFVSNQNSSD